MAWTPEADRLLLHYAESQADASTRQIAEALNRAGFETTKDAVQKRLKKLRAELHEETPPVPEHEAGFVLPEPEDGFVGFRLAFWDLETTDLGASMGRLLCCSIADNWGNVTTRRASDFERTSVIDDSGLAEWIRDELERYDIIVSWNGFNFDHGFLQARLLRWGKRPLARKLAIDPMWKARPSRYGSRIGGSSLKNVSSFFRLDVSKSELDKETWQLAGAGDEEAIAYIVDHCERDVLVLRKAFHHLKPLIQTIHT